MWQIVRKQKAKNKRQQGKNKKKVKSEMRLKMVSPTRKTKVASCSLVQQTHLVPPSVLHKWDVSKEVKHSHLHKLSLAILSNGHSVTQRGDGGLYLQRWTAGDKGFEEKKSDSSGKNKLRKQQGEQSQRQWEGQD